MTETVFYRRPNGRKPASEWMEKQDKTTRADIRRRIRDLSEKGLRLLGTKRLDIIRGQDNGFYELRNRTMNWRIGVYHDLRRNEFVLLHGWRHDKNNEREIEKARAFLHEYLAARRD